MVLVAVVLDLIALSQNRHYIKSYRERRTAKSLTKAENLERKHRSCAAIRAPIGARKYKPTLVVCESSSGVVWTKKI